MQSGDGVDAVSDTQTIGGRYAIVTAPPTLAGRIEYEPPVSVGRDQVTQRFAMGAAVKVLVTYERAFWRDAGFSGEVVSSDGPLSVVYDNTSHDGQQPALIGFVVGSQARQWSAQPLSDRQRRVTGALKRYFGEEAASFQEYHELAWGAEPNRQPSGLVTWKARFSQANARPTKSSAAFNPFEKGSDPF